jgi:hypothetical protein
VPLQNSFTKHNYVRQHWIHSFIHLFSKSTIIISGSSSNAPWSWWNAREVKLAEKTAVLGHATLTLEDLYGSQTKQDITTNPTAGERDYSRGEEQGARHYLDGDSGLLVLVGGEHLRLLGRDDSVPRDQLGHDSTDGLNTQGEGSHIKEEDICTRAKSHFCKEDDH